MATCLTTINAILSGGLVPTLPVFLNNTVNTFEFAAGSNSVYYLEAFSFQSTTFQLTDVPSGVSTPNFQITIYLLSDDLLTATSIGTVNVVDLITSFPKDLNVGKYLFCFHTNAGLYTGTIIPSVVDYHTTSYLSPRAYQGTNLQATLPYIRPPKPCSEVMYFEQVGGSLPPGIELDGLGRLFGQLPNLDCISDDDPLSPSQNWWWTAEDGTTNPWGRQWRFQVKTWVASYPFTPVTSWLCISVVNNWSYDRDNFAAQVPFTQDVTVASITPPKKLPKVLCAPCDAPPAAGVIMTPKPLPVVDPSCPDCQAVYDIPAEAIQVRSASDAIQFFLDHQNDEFCCQAIQDFIQSLKTNPIFIQLLAQMGYGIQQSGFTAVATVTNSQLVLNKLVDGRNADDLDYLMLQLRDQVNQSLPTTGVSWHGEEMRISFQTKPSI